MSAKNLSYSGCFYSSRILENIAPNDKVDFGVLKVIGDPFRLRVANGPCCHVHVVVACECGTIKVVDRGSLLKGVSTSCGCVQRKLAASRFRTHGGTNTRLYNIRTLMLARCYNQNDDRFADYGGRGITICEEWQESFEAFRDWAMANGYADGLSIDRRENDGNYEPGNCRWITMAEQASNKRTNRIILAFGESKPVSEWSRDPRCKVRYATLWYRIERGMDPEWSLTTPKLNPQQQAKAKKAAQPVPQ